MSSESDHKGRKRSKSYYRKCAHGGKKQRLNTNVLEPGIRGFLVMCNHNEKNAVRETYNILNEYADSLYGLGKAVTGAQNDNMTSEEDDDEDDDIEKALKKEVDGMKNVDSSQKRFQNVMTKAKNCVFIRTTLINPVEVVSFVMNDIAEKKLKRARFAARILPIIGTCKANTSEIEKLAADVLPAIFSPSAKALPESFTIIFKARNNNGTSCGREGVVSSLIKIVRNINSDVKFSWSDYSVAVLVEIVCTVCCIGVAPDYIRLRKFNLQELSKGAVTDTISKEPVKFSEIGELCEMRPESDICEYEKKEKGELRLESKSDVCVEKEKGELRLESESDSCIEKEKVEYRLESESEICVEKEKGELRLESESDICIEKEKGELRLESKSEIGVEKEKGELRLESESDICIEKEKGELRLESKSEIGVEKEKSDLSLETESGVCVEKEKGEFRL